MNRRYWILLVAAIAGVSAIVEASPKTDSEWDAFLARQGIDFDHPLSSEWGESLFIADGLTGASIYRMPGKEWALRWEMGRTDVCAEYVVPNLDWRNPARVPIGNLVLTPAGKVLDSNMQLDIWNAEARFTIKTDRGLSEGRSFIGYEHGVLIVETKSTEGQPQLDIAFREEWSISPRFKASGSDPQKWPLDQLPPKPYRQSVDGINVVVQPLTKKGAHATAILTAVDGQGVTRTYLAIGKAYLPRESQQDNIQAAIDEAVGKLKAAHSAGVETVEVAHRDWWHGYMSQAFVSLPDARDWEKFYWMQIYKFGSATRADLPIVCDILGPWYTYTKWPYTWWNMNTQVTYFPAFLSNRIEPGLSMVAALDKYYKLGTMRSKSNPRAITVPRNTHYVINGGHTGELGNLTWQLHNYWRFWKYTMDERLGRNLFPILRDNINFYFDVMDVDDDGTIHLPAMTSPEYPTDPSKDTNYSLQLFHWGLKTLVDLIDRLGMNDPLRSEWVHTLEHLREFPTNGNGLMISVDVPYEVSHRHYSHLLALYPLHSIHPDQGPEAEALFRKSLEHWTGVEPNQFMGFSYHASAAMYAMLGDGDRALEELGKLHRPAMGIGIYPNTMYSERTCGRVLETPLAAVEGINYLLLQDWADTIRVFPAMPTSWRNAVFRNLRTEGAFLVSAERKNGQTQWIEIKSLAGELCVLETDMERFQVHGQCKVESAIGPRGQRRWRIHLKRNEIARLVRKNLDR